MRTTFLLAAVLLVSTACSSVQTTKYSDFRTSPDLRYAWSDSTPTRTLDADGNPLPWGEFRSAIEQVLEERGLRKVDAAEASVQLDADLSVAIRTRNNDPYFNLYVAERFEEATYRIEFRSSTTNAILWIGQCGHRLRFTERAKGGATALRWTTTNQQREWDVTGAVKRILDRLPHVEQ